LDLLQEISRQIGKSLRSQTDKVWGKVADLAYGATLGMLKQYQQKTVELAKITLVSLYVQALRATRRHLLLFCLLIFGTVVSAVATVVIPVVIVLLTPWSAAIKAGILLVLGSCYIAGTAWVFLVLFSEDRWMKISGMKDFLDQISSSDDRF
jgi:hypothetical protein